MDKKDIQIINALQNNSRMTNQELAAQINLSPSPCLRRVKLLEQDGVIKRYSIEVDQAAYGLPISVFISISLERHTEESVQKFEHCILDASEVLECYVMSGTADYLLRVIVKDLEGYEQFVRHRLHPIGEIASIDTSFVYGVVKKTNVFPVIE